MALTTDPWDATELVAYISETWTPLVNEEFFAKAVASNFFTDLTSYAQAGSDIFHLPNAFTNTFTVQDQTTQGAEVTTDSPATTDDTLTINVHSYVALLLGYLQQQQVASMYSINEIYARQAGGVLMEDLEATIFALQSSVSTNSVNDTASVVNDTDIRNAIEKLASADVPLEECAFFFHPYTYWQQIHAIQKYYDASQAGWAGNSPVVSGNFGATAAQKASLRGQLFGIPVYTSSKVVNTLNSVRNLLAHKRTFAFATQTPGGNRIRTQSANWLANLGVLTVLDIIYGTAEMREEAAVKISGSNAFIAS